MFEIAISGDLRGLRALANVCIEGARVALAQGKPEIGLKWLERALEEPDCPPTAATMLRDVQLEISDGGKALAAQPRPSSSNAKEFIVDALLVEPESAPDESALAEN